MKSAQKASLIKMSHKERENHGESKVERLHHTKDANKGSNYFLVISILRFILFIYLFFVGYKYSFSQLKCNSDISRNVGYKSWRKES